MYTQIMQLEAHLLRHVYALIGVQLDNMHVHVACKLGQRPNSTKVQLEA